MNARPGRNPHRHTAALIALALAALLGMSSVAQAGLTISAPAPGAVVNLDAKSSWRIKFATSCPAGRTCGSVGNASDTLVPDNVFFDIRQQAYTGDDADGRFQNGLWYWDSAAATTAEGSAVVDHFDSNASGRWTISTVWLECPLSSYPYETADDPCTRRLVQRPVTIRPTLFEPYVGLYGVSGKPRLAGTTVTFYRNGPRTSYRVKVVVQRRVRVRGRWRWKNVVSRANRRLPKSAFSGEERRPSIALKLPLPRTIPGSAKLRARATVTTVGLKPGMKRRTLTTKVTTRAALKQQSTGGGIVIGS